jgi:tetratricopeptide (TPR) repeat protein
MPRPADSPRPLPLREIAICALMAVLVVTAFWGVWHFEYVYFDDPGYVLENPYVQRGLTAENIKWAFTTWDQSNWHPLAWISHMVDIELFGFDAPNHPRSGGPHVVNIIFHILNTCLLFVLLRWMTKRVWPSAIVAGFFAVHPMHVESVVWVAERKDMLSTFLGFITIAAYVWYTKAGSFWGDEETAIPGFVRYVAVFVLFAIGLTAKPMLVTLPCLFLLLDYWPLRRTPRLQAAQTPQPPRPAAPQRAANMPRRSRRKRREQAARPVTTVATAWERMLQLVLEKVPLLVLSLISSVLTGLAQNHGGSMASIDQLKIWLRVVNALNAYALYICSMFYPHDMAVLYLPPDETKVAWRITTALVAAAVLGTITLLVLLGAWFGRRYLLVGWLWYLGVLVPVIGFVQVGEQMMADRYTYISYVGLFIMIVWGLGDLLRHWLKEWPLGMAAGLFGGAIVALLVGGYAHGVSYHVGVGKLAHEVSFGLLLSPDRCWLLALLAGWPIGALLGIAAAALIPGVADDRWPSPKQWPAVTAAYGVSLLLAACVVVTHHQIQYWRNSDAILQQTLKVCPNNWSILNNLGVLNWERSEKADHEQRPAEAEELRRTAMKYWNTAVGIRPGASDAQSNLGYALAREANKDPAHVNQELLAQAIEHLQLAIQYKEILPEAHNNLGLIHKQLGHVDDAIREFSRAIELRPSQLDARDNLAQVYMEKGDAAAKRNNSSEADHWNGLADEQVHEILKLNPFHTGALHRLTMLGFKRGNFEEASAAWQNVVEKDRNLDHPDQLTIGQITAHEHLAALAWKQSNVADVKAHLAVLMRVMKPSRIVGERMANFVIQSGDTPQKAVSALQLAAWVLATSPDDNIRNGIEAAALAEKAVQITGRNDPLMLDTLAAAYAAAGHFAEAAHVADEAAQLAQRQGRGEAAAIRAHADQYRRQTPLRDAS